MKECFTNAVVAFLGYVGGYVFRVIHYHGCVSNRIQIAKKDRQVNCRQCGKEYQIGLDGLCPDCQQLKDHPDELSAKTHLYGVPFKDMKQVDEADRPARVAKVIQENPGANIGVIVDCGPGYKGKPERFIAAVAKLVPGVQAKKRRGPVPGAETITFHLPPNASQAKS